MNEDRIRSEFSKQKPEFLNRALESIREQISKIGDPKAIRIGRKQIQIIKEILSQNN